MLAEFRDFLGDFKSIASWVAKIAVASPFVDLAINIGPPWPARVATSVIAAAVQAVILMYVFEFLVHSRLAIARKAFAYCSLSFFVALLVYVVAFSQFVVPAGDQWNREVIGFILRTEVAEYAHARGDAPDAEALLREFKRAEKIWVGWTITSARVVVVFVWVALWGSLAAAIAAFVATQRLRAALVQRSEARAAKGKRNAEPLQG